MNDNTILRKPDIRRLTGFSDTTIRLMEARGTFPKRFKINPDGKIVGWSANAIRNWIEARGEPA